jgi:hypothetical protein
VASDTEGRGVGEVLAAIAANVAAVPVVLGLVTPGGVVLAGRALGGVARQPLGSRDGKPQRVRKRRTAEPPEPK